ncbi:hypothetical protein [Jannaschia sp. R86511]|uniref:hypothetical protein n=1 Tax=Jannaschia sp. R86511 TaxID=3093853 RepID=UPI0036D22C84
MTATVRGGAGGVSVQLDELDALAVALTDASGDCARLVAQVVRWAADPSLLADASGDPWALARVAEGVAAATSALCLAGGRLATVAAGVAASAAAYRAGEAAVGALARGVPAVLAARARATVAVAAAQGPLPLAATGLAAVGGLVLVGAGAAGGAPGPLDLLVRGLPAGLGVPDVAGLALVVSRAGTATGLLAETPVRVTDLPAAGCTAPAGGVADLLRRGQSVAAWREPGPGGHDTLPPGAPRPVRGQVRIDRVQGADGAVAWVVHVPGTQEWDGDGHGSPMDLAANVALVGGAPTGVADGVARALVEAGARPDEPVAVVGHSQGGMTAVALAADPGLRRVARITHVVTAGSPLPGRTLPPGVQVLALEHRDDLVPRLDGRRHPDRTDQVTVTAPAPGGPWHRDAVPAHSSSAYVVTAERVDASRHPSLVAYRAGLAPFLDRTGAACSSRHVVLSRDPVPSR